MATWLSDASANRHIKTYIKDFLDVSGNMTIRHENVDISGGRIGIGTNTPGHALDILGENTMIRVTDPRSTGRSSMEFHTDNVD